MTKVKYAMTGSLERDFSGMTVGQLVNDREILSSLRAPEGVVAIADGETLDSNELVSDHPTIVLEKRAASKA